MLAFWTIILQYNIEVVNINNNNKHFLIYKLLTPLVDYKVRSQLVQREKWMYTTQSKLDESD